MRNILAVCSEIIQPIFPAAVSAMKFRGCAVQLIHLFTSGFLVKSVYVLCNYRYVLSVLFKLCQSFMYDIRLCTLHKEISEKAVKQIRVFKKAVAA